MRVFEVEVVNLGHPDPNFSRVMVNPTFRKMMLRALREMQMQSVIEEDVEDAFDEKPEKAEQLAVPQQGRRRSLPWALRTMSKPIPLGIRPLSFKKLTKPQPASFRPAALRPLQKPVPLGLRPWALHPLKPVPSGFRPSALRPLVKPTAASNVPPQIHESPASLVPISRSNGIYNYQACVSIHNIPTSSNYKAYVILDLANDVDYLMYSFDNRNMRYVKSSDLEDGATLTIPDAAQHMSGGSFVVFISSKSLINAATVQLQSSTWQPVNPTVCQAMTTTDSTPVNYPHSHLYLYSYVPFFVGFVGVLLLLAIIRACIARCRRHRRHGAYRCPSKAKPKTVDPVPAPKNDTVFSVAPPPAPTHVQHVILYPSNGVPLQQFYAQQPPPPYSATPSIYPHSY